jgi:hypothetical protein
MTAWVVDDGPLGVLARELDPGWSWPVGSLHVLEAVVRGAQSDKSGRRQRLLTMSSAGGPAITQHSVLVGSAADAYLANHLRPIATGATEDLGEHESIAWMLHEGPSDSVFVTLDKGAAFLALTELGRGRVASPYELWADLLRRGLIARAQFDSLCEQVQKGWNLRLPPRFRAP